MTLVGRWRPRIELQQGEAGDHTTSKERISGRNERSTALHTLYRPNAVRRHRPRPGLQGAWHEERLARHSCSRGKLSLLFADANRRPARPPLSRVSSDAGRGARPRRVGQTSVGEAASRIGPAR